MAEADVAQPRTVFLRRSSGVVRAMSVWDGMFFGYLSATGIYALVFYFFLGAGAFPQANYFVGILLSFVFFFFIFAVYAFLGSSMPRSGGDYVFTSRIVNPGLGFVCALAGWVFWQFVGCFFAASAVIQVIIAPLFSVVGIATGNHTWFHASDYIQQTWPRIILVIAVILLAGWIMASGLSWYLKVQRYFLAPAAVLGLIIVALVMLFVPSSTFFTHLDQFQRSVGGLIPSQIIPKARSLGWSPTSGNSVFDTLGFSVNMSYSMLWTMWTTELFGELKNAGRVKTVFGMFSGSHILMFITLLVGFVWAYNYVGVNFIRAFAWMALNNPDALGGNWGFRGAATFFYVIPLNTIVGVLIFITFLGPASQSLFNTILAASRFLLAMSFDRIMPAWMGRVNDKGVPDLAIWFGVGVAAALTILLELVPKLQQWLFWSSFATLGAMFVTVLAGVILPWRKKEIFAVSPAAGYYVGRIPLITICGVIGCIFLFASALAVLTLSQFGMFNPGPARVGLIFFICLVAFSILYFYGMKWYQSSRGIEVSQAFQEVPPA
jgi:basic amino acid/polyamine antiporter, APA family